MSAKSKSVLEYGLIKVDFTGKTSSPSGQNGTLLSEFTLFLYRGIFKCSEVNYFPIDELSKTLM
jgi:hypothetical protein